MASSLHRRSFFLLQKFDVCCMHRSSNQSLVLVAHQLLLIDQATFKWQSSYCSSGKEKVRSVCPKQSELTTVWTWAMYEDGVSWASRCPLWEDPMDGWSSSSSLGLLARPSREWGMELWKAIRVTESNRLAAFKTGLVVAQDIEDLILSGKIVCQFPSTGIYSL